MTAAEFLLVLRFEANYKKEAEPLHVRVKFHQQKLMADLKHLQDMLKSYQKSLRAVRAHKEKLKQGKKYKPCDFADTDNAEKYYLAAVEDCRARIAQKRKY